MLIFCRPMARKTLKLLVFAILVIWLSWPIVELFDNWDKPAPSGDDTQYSITVLGLCVGAAYIFSRRTRLFATELARAVAAYLRLLLPIAPFVSLRKWAPHCLGPPRSPPCSFAILRI